MLIEISKFQRHIIHFHLAGTVLMNKKAESSRCRVGFANHSIPVRDSDCTVNVARTSYYNECIFEFHFTFTL